MTIQLDPNQQALIALIAKTQKDFANIVRSNRIARNLTQTGLGVRVGMPQSRICHLENHGTNKLDIAMRLAYGFGVPLSELIKAAEDCNSTSQMFSVDDLLRVNDV